MSVTVQHTDPIDDMARAYFRRRRGELEYYYITYIADMSAVFNARDSKPQLDVLFVGPSIFVCMYIKLTMASQSELRDVYTL